MKYLGYLCLIGILQLYVSVATFSQGCNIPFNIRFEKKTTTSIMVSWSDINNLPEGWEIELVKRSENPKGMPTLPLQKTKSVTITNLIPSTSYDLYIRTVCPNGRSNWNVAIPFTTVIEAPSACQLNIPLKDNGTEILDLEIPELNKINNPILGVNIFLKSVDLMIEHAWPADLKLILESPQGQQLLISNHNGTVTRNFGLIQDESCTQFTSFSMDGCLRLKDRKPPFVGLFHPDDDIFSWKPDTLNKGSWKLISFDRAIKDAGILKYINITFSEEVCVIPDDFAVQKTDINEVTLTWKYKPPCNTVSILLYENEVVTDTFYIPCSETYFTVENLKPNTEYGFSIASLCSHSLSSSDGCVIYASTSCEPVSLAESFDNYPTCEESCLATCNNTGTIWFNDINNNEQNWILTQGKTQTDFTGPDGDVNGSGKYLYIENNPQLCGASNRAILQSTCMEIQSNPSGCDMSFYYHMFGEDIGSLRLDVSVDGGESWKALFFANGNQGDKWIKHTLSLKAYDGQLGIFRFVGESGAGPLADIALDQIAFYKTFPADDQVIFFRDVDGDGFGSNIEYIQICSIAPPSGFVSINGDCDDSNANIYPGALEIQCNGIDENCNGLDDDQPNVNPMLVSAEIQPSSCNGSKDGMIQLHITGGNPPYRVEWNNGMTGEVVSELPAGIYYATITDFGGCIYNSNFYTIQSNNTLNIVVSSIESPSCLGKQDGKIDISHTLESPPYHYEWSNGHRSKTLENVPEGTYHVTVTDAKGCFSEMAGIKLTSKSSVIAGIQSKSDVSCYDRNDGKLDVFAINGRPPYNYYWSTGASEKQINNLSAGIYSCTVMDDNGCQFVLNTEIFQPEEIKIQVGSTEDVRCYDESNGSIKTNVTGGVPGYTYLWNNFSYTNDDILNLKAGLYILTVTDANGCKQVSPPIQINQPDPLLVTIDTIIPATCLSGNDGSIRLKTSGGNGAYFFVWNEQGSKDNSLENITRGHYNVTVYDQLGCKSGIPDIEVPYKNEPIQIQLNLLNDNQCYKETNAIIEVLILNGTPAFDYNWSHGIQYFESSVRDTIAHLASGRYTLTITDNNGCTGVSNPLIIEEKPAFNYSVSEIQNNLCAYDSNGSIEIQIHGGQLPLHVIWNDGLYNGAQIEDLKNGHYYGVVQDNQGCQIRIDTIPIFSNSNMEIEAEITSEISGQGNGGICLNVMSGVAPYQYQWSNNVNGYRCITQLNAGIYEVTVTDAIGCTLVAVFTVEMTSAVDDYNHYGINVYPNPLTDYVHILSNFPLTGYQISDVRGNILDLNTILDAPNMIRLDFENYPKGVYILILSQGEKKYRYKLVKL